MFVRKKVTGRRTYYYLVECCREGNRVRQNVLCYLGAFPRVEDALRGLPALIEKYRRDAVNARNRMEEADREWNDRPPHNEPREPPKPKGILSMGRHFRKILSSYWTWKERAKVCDQRADDLTARLDKLREVLKDCSAHVCSAGVTDMGTTSAEDRARRFDLFRRRNEVGRSEILTAP